VTSRQLAILCALALAWGCSFLFIKVIVDAGIEPLGMSALRTLLGALTLVPFAWAHRSGFRQPRRAWLAMVALGAFNFAVPWTIFGVAGQHVPTGVSAVANASTPLWAAIIATTIVHADHLTPRRAAGLALGFAGVLVLMAPGTKRAASP
jgi:drug/metabolite transporter (DMT)-like permease